MPLVPVDVGPVQVHQAVPDRGGFTMPQGGHQFSVQALFLASAYRQPLAQGLRGDAVKLGRLHLGHTQPEQVAHALDELGG